MYQLRQEGSCWSLCFPSCRAIVQRQQVGRVCRGCEGYFYDKYGSSHYKKFIQNFLEYKEAMGWGTTVIDPRTVPQGLLLNRQSAPAALGTAAGFLGIGRGRGRGRGLGQPFQPHRPMLPVHRESEADSARFPPEVRIASTGQLTLSNIPDKNKPLPADPSLFAVGDDSDDDGSSGYEDTDKDNKGKSRVATPLPQARYRTGSLPPNVSVVPELAHLAQGRHPSSFSAHSSGSSSPDIAQPVPHAPKVWRGPRVIRNVESGSLVEKLTAAAMKMDIPNVDYFEYDGMYVPRILTPPKGRNGERAGGKGEGKGKQVMSSMTTPPSSSSSSLSWLSSSPDPSPIASPSGRVGAINIALAADDVPNSLVPGHDGAGSNAAESISKSPSTYFVVTQPDANSPTGASARVRKSPSHETVAVPPPRRLDGILIPPISACPHAQEHAQEHEKGKGREEENTNNCFGDQCPACRGSFFKERGLPSESYLEAECRSATLARSPASSSSVLVSVSVPRRRYSCAVQSCYCDDRNAESEENKCPSCRERDISVKELNMTWI
ncbi:hypothetical protein F5B17DRAFT_432797 [Nemania serpens]|nr:hypothetical protein F5B17DRAFT_432797 [Nemania serpens]